MQEVEKPKKNIQLQKLINDEIVNIMPVTTAENVSIGKSNMQDYVSALEDDVSTLEDGVTALRLELDAIESGLADIIPEQANEHNQLADKEFVLRNGLQYDVMGVI